MKPRVLTTLALAAALLLAIPTAASAKGASAATIDGGGSGGLPGGPITLRGDGEPGSGTDLANLAELAGLFAVVFEGGQGGVLQSAPTDRLGPRYTITWTFPGGDGKDRKVRQDVYPYAATGPVTSMAAGQPVLDATTRTMGGWFQANDSLRLNLVSLGLPDRKPLAAASDAGEPAAPAPAPAPATAPAAGTSPAAWPKMLALVAGLLLVAGLAALGLRRRPHDGTATAR
ncbi:MAG TPA: hypothetical protein VGR68_06645 [Actinomycetota bacterium]|nr:hypothetical protein [Actinomycetota bacterium]